MVSPPPPSPVASKGKVLFWSHCRAVGCAGFFFASCNFPVDCAGLNRQDRSFRYSGGPETEPKHHAARQSTVSNRPECTNVRSGHQI